jgi:membrane protease YdiL (CAAX protease family)
MLSQGALLLLAWLTGRSFDYHLFLVGSLGAREILAAFAALAACFVLRSLARAFRSEEERRKMAVYLLAPRSPREWALWTGTVMLASVAEEAAYRGVGMSILWYSLGNPWAAAFICATAFSLAHWAQGWKSAAVIFALAMVMHGLVALSGTLVLAMMVHATYDFVAGYRIGQDAARYDKEAAAET